MPFTLVPRIIITVLENLPTFSHGQKDTMEGHAKLVNASGGLLGETLQAHTSRSLGECISTTICPNS